MAKVKSPAKETGVAFIALFIMQLFVLVRYESIGIWNILEMLACVVGAIFAFMKNKKLLTISVAIELVIVFVSFIQFISFDYLIAAISTLASLFLVLALVLLMILYASNAMEIKLSKSAKKKLKTLTTVFVVLYFILIMCYEIIYFLDIPEYFRAEFFESFFEGILLLIARFSLISCLQKLIFEKPNNVPESKSANTANVDGQTTKSLFSDDECLEEVRTEPIATTTTVASVTSAEEELQAYTELFEKGIISKREYEAKKKSLGIK